MSAPALPADVAAIVRDHAPPVRTPATYAKAAAEALAWHAENIAAASDLAHRPGILCDRLLAWGRACDVEIRNGRGLPEWPRWRGVPRSPHELAAIFRSGEKGSQEVEALGEDVAAWGREWAAQQDEEVAA